MLFYLYTTAALDEAEFVFDVSSEKKDAAGPSVKLIVGVVAGSVALVGLAAVVVGLVVTYQKRKRTNYEKVPLLSNQ